MKLLLKLMYDGGRYCGFQAQKNGRSVQETLTAAMSSLFGTACAVTGCSRTDAGVHALGFCAAVAPVEPSESWLTIPTDRISKAAERFLPGNISIRAAAVVDDSFHPRYDVESKEYIYRMIDAPYRDPFADGRAWQLSRPITEEGLDRMNKAAQAIVGTHDFSSFMAAGSKITDPRRTVSHCSVQRDNGMGAHGLTLRIAADGFLYNMVRIITGTLVDTAYGTFEPDAMPAIIAARSRQAAGKTAPPIGLYLNEVTYRKPVHWL